MTLFPYMGEHLKDYKPRRNLHRLINELLSPPRFAVPVFAFVTQEKKIPDVSFYQGAINWDAMRTRTDAVIIRGGQGTYPDIQFTRNWTIAKRLGVKRGVYWFFDDRYSPGAQAEKLASLVHEDMPEMEIWIDWENSYGGAFAALRNVVAMMERVEALLPGVVVGMYTGYYFFVEHSNIITNAAQYNYLKSHPLWLGWYTSNAVLVKIPVPWTSLLLWQFGTPAEGSLYGVETVEIDMSYFNGTQAEFESRYGVAVEPPPDTGETMRIIRGTAKGSVQRRMLPAGSAFVPPRYLVLGDQIEASENSAQWLHLTKINGVAVTGTEWASAGSTQQYISWDWVEVVVEPPPPPPADGPPVHIDIQLASGSTLTVTDAEGNVLWSAVA